MAFQYLWPNIPWMDFICLPFLIGLGTSMYFLFGRYFIRTFDYTNLKIYAPQRLWEEYIKNKKEILSKSTLSERDFQVLSSLLLKRITLVNTEEYKEYLAEAKRLLKGHEKDKVL